MEAVSARCLDHVPELHLTKRRMHSSCNFYCILEGGGRIRVQVHQEKIMPVSSRSGREELIDLQAGHVSQPDQGRFIVADDVSDRLVLAVRPYRDDLDPCRMVWPVFLDKRFSGNSVG